MENTGITLTQVSAVVGIIVGLISIYAFFFKDKNDHQTTVNHTTEVKGDNNGAIIHENHGTISINNTIEDKESYLSKVQAKKI